MIEVFVECEANSRKKNRYDEKSFQLLKSIQLADSYPYPYGFIPGTLTEDGEAVDCYIVTNDVIFAGEMVQCEPIGLFEFFENGEKDHKVIAKIPGQKIPPEEEIIRKIRSFLNKVFAVFKDDEIAFGVYLPKSAALELINSFRI